MDQVYRRCPCRVQDFRLQTWHYNLSSTQMRESCNFSTFNVQDVAIDRAEARYSCRKAVNRYREMQQVDAGGSTMRMHGRHAASRAVIILRPDGCCVFSEQHHAPPLSACMLLVAPQRISSRAQRLSMLIQVSCIGQ